MAKSLDQLAIDNMVGALQSPAVPLPTPDPRLKNVPLPPPDPRGTTFSNRIAPSNLPPSTGKLREYDPSDLLAFQGINPSADRSSVRDLSSLAPVLPPSYGAGRHTIYTHNMPLPTRGPLDPDAVNALIEALKKQQ